LGIKNTPLSQAPNKPVKSGSVDILVE